VHDNNNARKHGVTLQQWCLILDHGSGPGEISILGKCLDFRGKSVYGLAEKYVINMAAVVLISCT